MKTKTALEDRILRRRMKEECFNYVEKAVRASKCWEMNSGRTL